MTNKKPPLILFLLGIVAVGLYALMQTTPESANSDKANKKFKAVTSFTVIADIARNVAGDAAIVESITKPGAEIHDYQPTPKDIIRAKGANVIFWNGMNLERWYERFLQDIDNIPNIIANIAVDIGLLS